MSLSAPFLAFADTLRQYRETLERESIDPLRRTAEEAVVLIQSTWPVDTGYSRSQWEAVPTADGAVIRCGADYSSFVFAKGDLDRLPIYPEQVSTALRIAADNVGAMGWYEDVTAAYFGEGRTTTQVMTSDGPIGVHRKMSRHAPPREREAWLTRCPELCTKVTLEWRGKMIEETLVPSDVVSAGQMTPGGARRLGR